VSLTGRLQLEGSQSAKTSGGSEKKDKKNKQISLNERSKVLSDSTLVKEHVGRQIE
jgi:hypothetical protein